MSSRNMIDLGDEDLIKQILFKLKNNKAKVRVWQKINKLNEVNFAQIEEINFHDKQVALRPYHGKKFILATQNHLYFHSGHRNTLFKSKILEKMSFHIQIEMPEFVKIQEARKEDRKSFGHLSPLSAYVKLDGYGDDIGVQVLDISDSGAALAVPRVFFEMITVGSLLSLVSENTPHLDNRIAGIRNKGYYAPDPKKPHFLKFRLGIELFDPRNFESWDEQS